MGPLSEFLTVPQVARAFGVRPKTVRDWIRRKVLASKKDRVTGKLYVPVGEVERRKADLEDWQPGLRPVTIKDDALAGVSTSDSKTEEEDMAKAKTEEQAQGQTTASERAPAQRERAPPAKKKSSWGTVLDDEDDGDEEEED